MDLIEEINKKRLLQQPTTKTSTFENIEDSDGDSSSTLSSSKSERSCKIRSRNPYLWLQDTETVEQISYDHRPDENDIIVSILETNGGNTSKTSDEERWQKHTKENKEKKIEPLRCQAEEAQALEKNKNKKKFKKNLLMRELLKQKMARGEIPEELTTEPKINGEVEENCNNVNGRNLVQSIDDPDFFYLRNTSVMNDVKDDDFRFEHRGVKKKVTPRDYALNEIPDECFKFQRKSK